MVPEPLVREFFMYFQIEIGLKYWLSKVEKCQKGYNKAKIKMDGYDLEKLRHISKDKLDKLAI